MRCLTISRDEYYLCQRAISRILIQYAARQREMMMIYYTPRQQARRAAYARTTRHELSKRENALLRPCRHRASARRDYYDDDVIGAQSRGEREA